MKIDWKHNIFLKIVGLPPFFAWFSLFFFLAFRLEFSGEIMMFAVLISMLTFLPSIAISVMRLKKLDLIDKIFFVCSFIVPILFLQ
jgi:uncharacterized membrane protein YhaH (DUF805 family)